MGILDTLPTSGSGTNWSYPNIGDTVEGTLKSSSMVERTEDDGTKRTIPVLCLTQADGTDIDVWVNKPAMGTAIKTAVFEAGGTDLEIGGVLKIQYYADGERKPGKSAPKQFRAKWTQPANRPATVSVDDF